MNQELINPKTWRLLLKIGIGFAVAFVAIWLIGFLLKTLKKNKTDATGQTANPDGTPGGWQIDIDKAYIDRMAKLGKTVHDEKDYSGYSSGRCELVNNIIQMRDEEIVALVELCKSQYGFDLRGDVTQMKGDGCWNPFGKEQHEAAAARLKNF
ncbi:MAG: hypothetical protein H7246_21800 [Phycisphaerae bacterium]|nr:hypothetical protein [Saprospiraceae bacterium]